jgi:Flp pilus assembly protein TadD
LGSLSTNLTRAALACVVLTTIGCKTTDKASNKSSEVNALDLLGREQNQPRSSVEWDKIVEQLARGPLSESEADLAFLIAENFINQKQLDPATRLMRSVFNSHPTLVSGIELVRLTTLNGDLTEAEQIARKLQLFYSKSPEPALARAYIAQLKGNRDEALEILDATIKKHPKNEEVSARYIALLIEAGKKSKAKEILMQAISSMPQSPYFLLRLAKLKTEEKQYGEAKNLLDKLLKLSPESIEGWTLAGFIATQENNGAAAEKYFREAYEKQPENDTLARYYVTQLLKLNKFHEARRLLLRLEASSEGEEALDSDLTFQLGYVLFQLEDFTEARKRFLTLVDKSLDKDRLYFYAAQCDERLKNNQDALALYRRVNPASDVYKVSLQRIILLLIEDGKFDESEKLLVEFQDKMGKKPGEEDFKFLASSHSKMRQFSKAQTFAEIGLQKHPQSVDLQYLKAAYLEYTVSKVASISALEKLIAAHPDHIQSLNHLGYTLGEANQKLEFALALVQRALQKDPKNGFYLDSLGWIQFKLKQFKESEKSLMAAHSLEPEEPVILEHLGELKLALGDYSTALKHFEKQPKFKIEADLEWSASRSRVEKRIQEIRRRALTVGYR